MKRLFHLGLWFLLGITAGFLGMYFFGVYWMGNSITRNETAMGTMSERATVVYYARAQYKYADRNSARQALLYDIQVFNQLKGDGPPKDIAQLVDVSDSYGELSLLEESAANTDLARKYMVQSVQALNEACMKAGRKEPGPCVSEASIRKRLGKEPFVAAMVDGKPQ